MAGPVLLLAASLCLLHAAPSGRAIAPPRTTLYQLNQKNKPDQDVEKVGLELSLINAFKSNEKPIDKAKDLLKTYGAAYLLTSTSLAAVSFALCYAAVDNGVDVNALLKTVNIQVTTTSETVSTVGIAYAIHKAASPIRFPPTVALTPIVARKLFKREEAVGEEENEED